VDGIPPGQVAPEHSLDARLVISQPVNRAAHRRAVARRRISRDLLRRWATSTWFLGVVLVGLSFPAVGLVPSPGLDQSWMAALHLAAQRGLDFGSQIASTFGPLGFLSVPYSYEAWTLALSAAYTVALQFGLCASSVSALRRSLGLPLAVALAFVIARVGRAFVTPELAVVVVFMLCVSVLRGDHSARMERLFVVLGGVVAAVHLLMKFNAGVSMLVMVAITAWFVGRRTWRSELVLAGAVAGTFATGWLSMGNRLTDVGRFLISSSQVASGYSEAMGVEELGRAGEYWLALLVIATLAALAWVGIRRWPPHRQVVMVLLGMLWLYFSLKHGFVRHDGAHALRFFGGVLVIASAFTWRKVVEGPVIAAFALLLLVFMQVSGTKATDLLNVLPTLRQASEGAVLLASPGRRTQAVTEARESMQQAYGIEAGTRSLIEGHSVHIHPWEAGVAWAFPRLAWAPMPIFQSYSAYTPALDEANARFLSSSAAPERILREQQAIDSRNPDWESPAATLAMVCHYVEVHTRDRWQVLDRVSNRCGGKEPLGTVETKIGQTVQVPDPGSHDRIMLAHVRGLDSSPAYRLWAQLLKIPTVSATVNGSTSFRLVPGTVSAGLLVRAPQRVVGYSGPFGFSPVHTIRIDHRRGFGLGEELTIEFVAVSLREAVPDG